MITCCPLGRIMFGFPASVSASTFPMTTPWPVAIEDASVAWMLVSASGSTSGLLGDLLHSCCPSAAVAGIVDFATWEAATVFVLDVASPMVIIPSGTTALTPGLLESACASAAGIVAATALRSESLVICVARTCLSWATSGAWIDAAVASRACRWARFAGRLASWSLNTTTTCLLLAGRAGFDLAQAQLRKAWPRHTGRGGRTGCRAGAGHRCDERGRTEQRSNLTGGQGHSAASIRGPLCRRNNRRRPAGRHEPTARLPVSRPVET